MTKLTGLLMVEGWFVDGLLMVESWFVDGQRLVDGSDLLATQKCLYTVLSGNKETVFSVLSEVIKT